MATPDGVMRAWRTHTYGQPLDVLTLDEVAIPDPDPGEMRIRVQAIPLNLNDLERITGGNMMVRPELPYSPGMEVMGVVDACGPGAEKWLHRRVVAITKGAHGGYAEYVVCPAAATFDMPDTIPLPDAAALYFPFHLAWLGLIARAELRAGETVLIHAAAGGIGSAAVQLASLAGARVIATAGSAPKLELCRTLGADVLINYNETDFSEAVLDVTDGRGVDVAFDSIGGEVTTKTFECMAFNGRHLLVGFASGIEAEDEGIVPRPVLFGNFSLCGVCHAYVDDPVALKRARHFNFPSHADGVRLHAQVLELVAAAQVRPVVGEEAPFDALPASLQRMADRQTTGRSVVHVHR